MTHKALKPVLPAIFLPFLALAAHGQAMTGYSHPDTTTGSPAQSDHYVKPSPATPAAAPAYQDSFPATAAEPRLITRDAATPTPVIQTAPLATPQSAPYAAVPAPVQTASLVPEHDHDGDIVLDVPSAPHELHRGTLLHARLREALNTQSTPEGAVFTAELLSDVGHHGEIMLPTGSLIRGHVTSVHGGKRITGGASIHLRPETISLPDGTLYRLDAQVTDLNSTQDLRVNDEGTVVLRSNPKAAAAVVGGVTATAAVTGAVIGGGVGAAVGAIAGAGVATAVYLKREVQESLPAGTDIMFALDMPLTVSPR